MVTPPGHFAPGYFPEGHFPEASASTIAAVLTGTALPSLTEAEVVVGGDTVIVTLTDATWVALGATFDAQRQNIINGLSSSGGEANGWNVEVRDNMLVGAVVRTSDTVVTITLPAAASFDITAGETITLTIPATAIVENEQVVAAPSLLVLSDAAAQAVWAEVWKPLIQPVWE